MSVNLELCPCPARCDEAQTCQGRCHAHVERRWTDTDPETGKVSHNSYAGTATAHDYQGATISREEHNARVTELLEANNREVERRRKAERELQRISFAGGNIAIEHPMTSPTTAALIEAGARALVGGFNLDWNALSEPSRAAWRGHFERGLAAFLDKLMATGPSEGMLRAVNRPFVDDDRDDPRFDDNTRMTWDAMLAELRREITDG